MYRDTCYFTRRGRLVVYSRSKLFNKLRKQGWKEGTCQRVKGIGVCVVIHEYDFDGKSFISFAIRGKRGKRIYNLLLRRFATKLMTAQERAAEGLEPWPKECRRRTAPM